MRAALAEAIDGDPAFADRLSALLNAPVQNTTGSVVISGSDVKRSQITLGPLTVDNTPSGWQERTEPVSGSASPCHQGVSQYAKRPYEGAMMVKVEFEVVACRSVKVAAGGFREEVETFRTSNEATAVSFPGKADEATALRHVNTDLDETTLDVIARVGTVVCWMKLDPVDELDDHMALAEELMGVCTGKAREVQAGS